MKKELFFFNFQNFNKFLVYKSLYCLLPTKQLVRSFLLKTNSKQLAVIDTFKYFFIWKVKTHQKKKKKIYKRKLFHRKLKKISSVNKSVAALTTVVQPSLEEIENAQIDLSRCTLFFQNCFAKASENGLLRGQISVKQKSFVASKKKIKVTGSFVRFQLKKYKLPGNTNFSFFYSSIFSPLRSSFLLSSFLWKAKIIKKIFFKPFFYKFNTYLRGYYNVYKLYINGIMLRINKKAFKHFQAGRQESGLKLVNFGLNRSSANKKECFIALTKQYKLKVSCIDFFNVENGRKYRKPFRYKKFRLDNKKYLRNFSKKIYFADHRYRYRPKKFWKWRRRKKKVIKQLAPFLAAS